VGWLKTAELPFLPTPLYRCQHSSRNRTVNERWQGRGISISQYTPHSIKNSTFTQY